MPKALAANAANARRDQWIARVEALVAQLAQWAAELGWQIERGKKTIEEDRLGVYEAPTLTIHVGRDWIEIDPVALDLLGRGDGRVDVKARPNLTSVSLIGVPEGWKIMTNSNVPLRVPWTRESFAQLIADLLA